MGSTVSTASTPNQPPAKSGTALREYSRLTKVGLNTMVVGTTCAGFLLASGARVDWMLLGWTLLGTALAALGASGLNQWLERHRDARMHRTRSRPLPARRLPSGQALAVAGALALGGDLLLAVQVNALTALLALIVQLVYLGMYTPLKPRSTLSTLLGGICGALPPMMGFSAATGRLEPAAWLLGALLFAWQIPHFLALAWMYRRDYLRGGYRMLPMLDESGRLNFTMLLIYTLALLPLGLAPVLVGLGGWTYALGSLLLGMLMVWLSLRLNRNRSERDARRVFLASVIYLPLVLILLVADHRGLTGAATEPSEAAPLAAAGVQYREGPR